MEKCMTAKRFNNLDGTGAPDTVIPALRLIAGMITSGS
jgi:hypothetical protein